MQYVDSKDAPQPAGHYSQAVIHNDIVYVAGQLPIDAATGNKILSSIEEQAEKVLQNIDAVLQAAGSDLQHVLKTTIYISDISLWGKVNEIYARFFESHRPARVVVPTRDLHYGFSIEMDVIACLKKTG